MNYSKLSRELRRIANPQKAKILQRFFKTGIGEYGEGDVFLGITVPQSRKIAIKFKDLPFPKVVELLKSKTHEERLIALLVLVFNFNRGDEKEQKKIYEFYLKNTNYINNWDLVDLSADKIVGGYLLNSGSTRLLNDSSILSKANLFSLHENLLENSKSAARFKSSFRKGFHPHFAILLRLAKSKNIWERRIAMIATYYFIKSNKFDETLGIAKILLKDKHDLIHKAVGWMLREVGKRDLRAELEFLNKHYKKMSRTMLRYAIEKLTEKLRQSYLANKE